MFFPPDQILTLMRETHQPAITVITVVLNDLAGLKRTYVSLAAQSSSDWEWVVCDGGSADSTTQFLRELSRPVHWVSERDKGIYDAMNHGVSMASGEYVVFMNAGDTFYDSTTLGTVVQRLASGKNPADVLFGGAMLSFSRSGRLIYRPPRLVENSIWHGLPANHQATFYRKAVLGTRPYDLQYRLCSDYYLAATLFKKGSSVEYLDMPLATFEVGGQSYRMLVKLFLEPYRIQRDVLRLPFYYRWGSLARRLISTTGFILLSQRIFKKRRNNITA